MTGKGGSKTPSMPSADSTAATQYGWNTRAAGATAAMNRVDQVSPFGSSTWTHYGNGPGDVNDKWIQETKLNDQDQRILNNVRNFSEGISANALPKLQDVITANAGQQIDMAGLPELGADTSRYEQALMDRMNPELDRQRAALETQLANQGITQGSEAWRTGIDDSNRQINDAHLAAILQAGQEQSRLAAIRQQGLQERLTQRNLPLMDLQALMG